jgi:hypothetical protein
MITSKDVYLMDRRLFSTIIDERSVSPELVNLINSMSNYLNLIAGQMEYLEKENERLNSHLIEINIG